jgi:hypothetical protein
MIDLEYTQVSVSVAVGKGVESGAEQHILAHAAGVRAGELVFGEPAPHRDKRAEIARKGRAIPALRFLSNPPRGVWADHSDGERIVEDSWTIQHLMCSAAFRHALGGQAAAAGFHDPIVRRTHPASARPQTQRSRFMKQRI